MFIENIETFWVINYIVMVIFFRSTTAETTQMDNVANNDLFFL